MHPYKVLQWYAHLHDIKKFDFIIIYLFFVILTHRLISLIVLSLRFNDNSHHKVLIIS